MPVASTSLPAPRVRGSALALAMLLFVLPDAAAQAQNGSVVGRVLAARTTQPLASVTIEIEGTRLGAVTDGDGRFRIPNVPTGSRTIVARRIGYGQARQTVNVEVDRPTTADFELQATPIALDQVVITGTGGSGERLRTIGSSVATINAPQAVQLAAPPTLGSLLNARAPGLLINLSSGRLGAGPSITIRGRSSIGQGNSPLLYVDGVRVNNATGLGAPAGGFAAQGSSVAGRLDDFSPDDIESIEVIKGPAASTIYGTEASNGVIQIITKKGAVGARPQFQMQVQHGTIYFRDPEGRLPTNYMKDASGNVVAWNAFRQEEARGTPLFKTGRSTGVSGSVSGGLGQLRYYASGAFDDETGIEPNNYVKQFSLHSNLNVELSEELDIGTSLHFVDKRSHLGTDQGLSAMLGATIGHTLLPLRPEARGFGLGYPPELPRRLYDNAEFSNRFTASGTVQHEPTEWLRQRLLVGMDYTDGDNRTLERLAPPDLAIFLTPTQAAGRIGQTLRRSVNFTVDYSGTATARVASALSAASSLGLQIHRDESTTSSLGGMGFPAPGVETVSGAATALPSSQSELLNTTVGGYVQEKFSWNDRLFITGALRVDNNSAFGEDFRWVTYPKADISWVVHEEPFWRENRWVNSLRLRSAYGESGRAPAAFSALRTFTPIQGPGGTTAVTPGSLGNPNLKPEESKELEVGFEVSLLDRLSLDFTYFDKTTFDQIVNQTVAPSSGFPGSVPLNVGRVDNHGFDLLAILQAFSRENFEWEVVANLAASKDRIKELGQARGAVTTFGAADRVGYPIGGVWSKRVVSADRDPVTKLATNVLCDGGPGNAPVACAQAPFVFLGTTTPTTSGAVSNMVTLFKRLRLYGLVDFRSGHRRFSNDAALRCTGAGGGQVCEANVYPERFSPVVLAEAVTTALQQGIVDQYFMDASFVKLRELSASYDFPRRWTPRVSQASLTVAARELATWTDFQGTDPENAGQAILPPLSRLTAALNIRF